MSYDYFSCFFNLWDECVKKSGKHRVKSLSSNQDCYDVVPLFTGAFFFSRTKGKDEHKMTIHIKEITKSYSQDIVLDQITMKITDGEHIAIVGENGCGKSTLLKIIAGIEHYQEGELHISKHTNIAYLNQMFDVFTGSVFDYLMDAFQEISLLQQKLHQMELQMADCSQEELEILLKRYGSAQERFEQMGGYDITTSLEQIAYGLSIDSLLDHTYETLSGGEKSRVNLAKKLLSKPDVLLLDEPTNHLDFKGIKWLEDYLHYIKETVLIVSHDRTFLNQTVSKIYEIECGELYCYHGNYDVYRKEKQQRLEQLQVDYEEQQKQIKKMKDAIRRFRQWGHEGDNEKFFKKAKMLEKRLAKIERLSSPQEVHRKLHVTVKEKERSSKEVIKLEHISKSFGSKLLFHDVSGIVRWQDRIAICGENGSGKSTLINMIVEQTGMDEGEIVYGNSVSIGYLPQVITFPDETKRILEYASYTLGMSEEDTRRYLIPFGFDAIDMMKRINMLSGGEKTRLQLAMILKDEVNLIIFDEPTNHLDFSSIEIIEQVLTSYTGTLLVVSHDRYFIKSLCNRIWRIEQGSIIEEWKEDDSQ